MKKFFKLNVIAAIVAILVVSTGCTASVETTTEIPASSEKMGFVVQLPGGDGSQRAAYYEESDATSYKVELKKDDTVIDTKTGEPGNSVYFAVTEEGLYAIKVSAYKDTVLIAEGQKNASITFGDGDVSVKVSLEPKVIETGLTIEIYWNTPLTGVTVGNTISLGNWPQTVKDDSVSITDESKTVGKCTYYKGSDDAWYAKCSENAVTNGYKYSDGTSVGVYGKSYKYFKVEPIEWLVLTDDYSGKKLLLSEKILATSRFNYDGNNYKESDIRNWLNNEFYNSAFTAAEQARIALTTVDNSAHSTEDYTSQFNTGINEYACEDTNDSIFLLSRLEVSKYEDRYSFFDGVRATSDYAKANGAGRNGEEGSVGGWWTRSPGNSSYNYAMNVNYGYPGYGSPVTSIEGIVPALCLE